MSKLPLSRAQRADRRATMKLLLVGGAALALGLGGAWGVMTFSSPPQLDPGLTLAERIEQGGLAEDVLWLRGTGVPDVVVVGSSDCVHCQAFVADGLDGFLEEAAALNLSVAYLGLATGPGSIVSAQALRCVSPGTDPVAALRATYALSGEVSAGLDPARIGGRLQTLAQEAGASVDSTCWAGASAEAAADHSRRLAQVLALQGTPSFYVAQRDNPGVIRVFSGFAGPDTVRRQLRKAYSE